MTQKGVYKDRLFRWCPRLHTVHRWPHVLGWSAEVTLGRGVRTRAQISASLPWKLLKLPWKLAERVLVVFRDSAQCASGGENSKAFLASKPDARIPLIYHKVDKAPIPFVGYVYICAHQVCMYVAGSARSVTPKNEDCRYPYLFSRATCSSVVTVELFMNAISGRQQSEQRATPAS